MAVDVLSLKYGAITRSDPLRLVDPAHLLCMHCDAPPHQENASVSCRFMVECRYSASSGTQKSLISVGVMVKTPLSSLPSTFTSYGLYSVHLRIARGKVFEL